jgi:uncharacterized protein
MTYSTGSGPIIIAGGSGFLGISLAEHLAASGRSVASSPNPVSQRVFMSHLRRAVGMPIGLPAYSWMVRVGAPWFLRTDPDLALYGRYVVSKRLQDEQFEFQFPQLSDALDDLLSHRWE